MSEFDSTQEQGEKAPASFLQNLINIVVSPVEAFQSLKVKPTVLLPLFVYLGISILAEVVYFQTVDFEIYVQSVINQLPGQMQESTEIVEAVEKSTREGGATRAMITSAISVAIILPLMFAIYSGYLCIITAATKDGGRFKQWFSFQIWSMLPSVLGSIAIMVKMLVSNGQVALADRDPISLNSLFLNLDPSHGFYSTATQLDLAHIYCLVLLVIGYRVLTKRSWLTSFLIVHIPTMLVIGIMFLIQSALSNMFS